ncbi:hypothetical protein HK405_002897 [Cladochytrium tenue]|nr:hypothetical protein HK405_002897 [Cladochytrium tenue]
MATPRRCISTISPALAAAATAVKKPANAAAPLRTVDGSTRLAPILAGIPGPRPVDRLTPRERDAADRLRAATVASTPPLLPPPPPGLDGAEALLASNLMAARPPSVARPLPSEARRFLRYTPWEDDRLREGYAQHGPQWRVISAELLPHRTPASLCHRWSRIDPTRRVGRFTLEEDLILVRHYATGGASDRKVLSALLPERRADLVKSRLDEVLVVWLHRLEEQVPDWRSDLEAAVRRIRSREFWSDPSFRSRRRAELSWTQEEDDRLMEAAEMFSRRWILFRHEFPNRKLTDICRRYWELRALESYVVEDYQGRPEEDEELERLENPWTAAEDRILLDAVSQHWGTSRRVWVVISQQHLPHRTPDEIQSRWCNSTDPLRAWTSWTKGEEEMLINAVQTYGPNFTRVRRLEGFECWTPQQLSRKWTQLDQRHKVCTPSEKRLMRTMRKHGLTVEEISRNFGRFSRDQIHSALEEETGALHKGYDSFSPEEQRILVELYNQEMERLKAETSRSSGGGDGPVQFPKPEFWDEVGHKLGRFPSVCRNACLRMVLPTTTDVPLTPEEEAAVERWLDSTTPGAPANCERLALSLQPPRRGLARTVRIHFPVWTPAADAALMAAVEEASPAAAVRMQRERAAVMARVSTEQSLTGAEGEVGAVATVSPERLAALHALAESVAEDVPWDAVRAALAVRLASGGVGEVAARWRTPKATPRATLLRADGSLAFNVERLRRRWLALVGFQDRTGRWVAAPRGWIDGLRERMEKEARLETVARAVWSVFGQQVRRGRRTKQEHSAAQAAIAAAVSATPR